MDEAGRETLAEIDERIERAAAKAGSATRAFQSNSEGALIDAFCEHIRDVKTEYQPYRKLEGEGGVEKFFGVELPAKLKALEKTLSPNDKWVIGDSVSLADVTLFSLVDFFDDKPKIVKILQSTPKLFESYHHLSNLPQIKEWLNTRPASLF